jgi:hypothetical protein
MSFRASWLERKSRRRLALTVVSLFLAIAVSAGRTELTAEDQTPSSRSDDIPGRVEAVQAAAKLGRAEAMLILDKAMRDGDWEVRQAAAIALGQVGGEKAIDLLADGLDDWSLNVASLAARSLADMEDPLVVEKMNRF